MKALLISDREFHTESFRRLDALVTGFFENKGLAVERAPVGRGGLASCMGCFGCWVKTPGECVIRDGMAGINQAYVQSDAVVYLSPVVYGQFSANLKDAVDRWLPNVLPFFKLRRDGSTMHPPRYEQYPKQVIIGYGDDLPEAEARLFTDITKKHRTNMDVLIYREPGDALANALDRIEWKREAGRL
jgi:hypothetical protein